MGACVRACVLGEVSGLPGIHQEALTQQRHSSDTAVQKHYACLACWWVACLLACVGVLDMTGLSISPDDNY